jgi:hypothetical protein
MLDGRRPGIYFFRPGPRAYSSPLSYLAASHWNTPNKKKAVKQAIAARLNKDGHIQALGEAMR